MKGWLQIFFLFSSLITQAQSDDGCLLKSKYLLNGKPTGFTTLSLKSSYDVKQYILQVNINPDTLYISGKVTIKFEVTGSQPMQQFDCHLSDDLQLDSVKYHDTVIPSLHAGGRIVADMPSPINTGNLDSISIFYHGVPIILGGFSSFSKGYYSGSNAIWTLSQPYGASDWWPCKNSLDDKADSLDIYITTPQTYQAASNGLLLSSNPSDTFITYHWRHRSPIATYLIAIAVAKYTIYTDYIYFSPTDSMAMLNYVYTSSVSTARPQTAKLAESMLLFTKLFGRYPFRNEKYGHAQFGPGGGMEHQTMSFVGNFNQDLLVHELAHQWFGDAVTCGSWTDLWLNEGFATYLTGMSKEMLNTNKQVFIDWKAAAIDQITRQPGGYIYTLDTLNVNRLFEGRLTYTKAAMTLHMLRKIVGDLVFFKAVNQYLQKHRFGFVYTYNLIEEMEKESGLSLKYFFSQWFYGEGYPQYNIYWRQLPGNRVIIDVYQSSSVSSIDFFNLPVTLRFFNQKQYVDVVLNNQFSGQQFDEMLPFEPDSVAFNPEYDMIAWGKVEQKGTVKGHDNQHLVVYPLDGSNTIQFEVTGGLTLRFLKLYDLSGKHIFTYDSRQPLNYGSIELPYLAPAVYLLQTELSDGSVECIKIPKFFH